MSYDEDMSRAPSAEELADYNHRQGLISAALNGASEIMTICPLSTFAGQCLSRLHVEDRKTAREDLMTSIDSETAKWVIKLCDA